MSEPPKGGGDPDATVMIPAAGQDPADPDATVMVPSERADSDATVMMPTGGVDPDAAVMVPADGPDPEGTVALPARGPDPDATIAIPTPGRRREAVVTAGASARDEGASSLGALGGLNPLVEAANPILAVVPQIRHALRHPDPEGLRARMREGIEAFEQSARVAGVGEEALQTASFALRALLDESAACTPWGGRWGQEALLADHPDRASAGEKFFERMAAATLEPAANLDLLEFFFVCLALGFEGKYRGDESRRPELFILRASLHEQIRDYRPRYEGELSGRWRGVVAPARQAPGALALWAVASGAALLLAAIYLGYSLSLGSQSDPVARSVAQLKGSGLAESPAVASAAMTTADSRPTATPGIATHLAAEIGRGEVAVSGGTGQSTIVIRGDRLFASGSARLEPEVAAIILRVAEALDRVPGTVLVTGHTDDVPIRTARFPSNWELSTERAKSVVKLMSAKLRDAARLRAEGLADSEPVAPNDSSANRARNRRVTIILRSAS